MARNGINLRGNAGIRRNSAEKFGCDFWDLLCQATRGKLGLVAGPSNTKPATNCQNRYPSPSKRSGQFPAGPLHFSAGQSPLRENPRMARQTLAIKAENGEYWETSPLEKGFLICKKIFGSRQLLPCCRFPHAETPRWSRRSLVRVLGLRPLLLLAETRQRALFLVVLQIFCIARKIRHCADHDLIQSTQLLLSIICGHRATAPVAVSVLVPGLDRLPMVAMKGRN